MNKYLIEAQALAREGNLSDAADLCKKAIKYGKDVVIAKRILANCLYDQGTIQAAYGGIFDEAEKNFRAAIAVNPNHKDALNSLGVILHKKNQREEAITLYQKASTLDPLDARVLENLANAQQQVGNLVDASETLLKLAKIVPSDAGAYLLREALLVQKIIPDKDYPANIRATIFEKLAAIEAGAAKIDSPLHFPSTYFALSYHGICNKDLVRRIAQIHLKAAPSLDWTAHHVTEWSGPKGRIKIGIASHFFRAHSIGNTSRGLVEHLDRTVYEVILIRLGTSLSDATAELIDKSADRVVTTSYDDLQAARKTIADLSLDILFLQDIGMEPLSYLLAFSRLAPVQCTCFGHPDTTGIPNLDYFISSENYETDGAEDHYSERLLLLPNAGTLSYYYRPPAPSGRGREAFGLNANDRIYLCPQTLFKIQPVMDDIFQAILKKDPAAKIVLIDSGELRPALERRLSSKLSELLERVIFIKTLPYEDFLSLISCSDVVLDTVHFNGQNTSLESFAMSIPVVTMPGRMQRERHTYGMYMAMGFMELVAANTEEYVAFALRVANDSEYHRYCQSRIAESCSILFENMEFVRNCEKAFQTMINDRLA